MSVHSNKETLIIKETQWPGVDKSVNDLTMLHTVRIATTKVTKTIFKKGSTTFIGLKDRLIKGDVIQVGTYERKYRIFDLVKVSDIEGLIYKIRRVDNKPTSSVDLELVLLGDSVKILTVVTKNRLFDRFATVYRGK